MRNRKRLHAVLLFVFEVQTDKARTRALVEQDAVHRQAEVLVFICHSGILRGLDVAFKRRIVPVRKQQREPVVSVRGERGAADAERRRKTGAEHALYGKTAFCVRPFGQAVERRADASVKLFAHLGKIVTVHHTKHSPFKS